MVLRAGGAGLSDEQREEMTNREGVAAGGATQKKNIIDILFSNFTVECGLKKGH